MPPRVAPLLVSLALLLCPCASAQEPARAAGTTPLGIRQQRVERMMDDLERKLTRLKLTLQPTEPDRAERLQQTLNKAKELLIQKRMADITRLLDETQLDAATDSQQALVADIRALLTLLLDEKSDADKAHGEIERSLQWKESIENLLQSQRREKHQIDQLTSNNHPRAADTLERFARNQDDIANQTRQLAREMQQAAAQSGSGTFQPGLENVQHAQQSMQQASGRLRLQELIGASHHQNLAIEQLQEALREVQERLDQLHNDLQRDKLFKLEAHFREMLQIQQRLTAEGLALEKKRADSGRQFSRADRNAVRIIGDEERRMETEPRGASVSPAQTKEPGLAGKAQQALDIIMEDGTTLIVPDILEQLRDDLVSVGNRLADDLLTDQQTTALQKEIEITLEDLIESLEPLQQQGKPQEGEAVAGELNLSSSGQKPLLPASSELKLLRSVQLQVNRRTAALDIARPQAGTLSDVQKAEAASLAARQAKIAEMTQRILKQPP